MAALDFDAIVNSSLAEDPVFGNSAIPADDIEAAEQSDWRDVTLDVNDLLGGQKVAPVEAPVETPVAEEKPESNLPPEPEYNPRPSSALPEGKVTPLLDGVTDGMKYPDPSPVGSSAQEKPTEKPMPEMSPSPEDPWYKKTFNYLFNDPEMNRAKAMNEYAARKIADEEGVSVESVYRDVGGARPMINPEGRQASQAFTETADVLLEEAKRTPEGAANAFLRTIRGGDIPLQDQSWLDEAITATKDDRNPADFDPNYKSFNNLGASLGYSLTTLVSSIIASATTTAATGGNVPLGTAAGMATSGAVAYRGSKDQFLTNVKDKLNQTLSMTENRTLTEQEWEAAKEQYDAAATKYGAWEAIPEAISNAIFLKAFVKPFGAVDDVAKLQRINQKAAALAAEQATETATGVGQNRAEVEAGLTAEEIDVVDAFRNQFIQTLIVSGGMMSATATTNAAKDFYVKNVEPKVDPKSALGRAILQELESVGSNPAAIDQFSRDSLNPNSSVVDPNIIDPGQTVPEEQLGEQVVEPAQAAPTEQSTEYNQQEDAAAIEDMEAAAAPAAADPIEQIVEQDVVQESTPVEAQEDPVVEQTAIEDMVDEALSAAESAIDTLEDGPIVSTPQQEEIKAPDYKEVIPAVSEMVKMKAAEVQAIAEEVGLNPQNTKGALIDQLADLRGGNAQPQINYADPRLAYKEYRDGLVQFLEREWVPNGGISIVPKPGATPTSNTGDIIYDYGADNVIRTQSVNAKWIQGLIQEGVTKKSAVNALQKAIDGKPLTEKQTAVVKTVLDESEGGNYGAFIPQSPATQQDLAAATQGIPLPTETEFGDYNTFDYVDDVTLAEAKNLVELHDEAARLGKSEEAMQIMEQQIPDAQIAQQLYKLIEDTKNGRSSETGTTGGQEGQTDAQAQETTEQPAEAQQDPGPTQEVAAPTERPTSDDLNLKAGEFNPPALPTLVNRRDQGDPKNQKNKGTENVGISGGEKEADITSRSMVNIKLAKVGFDGEKRQPIPENFEERVYKEYPESTLNKIKIVDRNETLRYQAAHYNGGIAITHNNFSWINWNTIGHLLAHELGHASHSLLGDTLNTDPRVINELGAIEQLLYPNLRSDIERTMQDPEKAPLVDVQFFNYLLSAEELIAEFNVSRLIDPARAKAIAPVTTGLLESVAQDPNLVIERDVFPSGYKILRDTIVKPIDSFNKEYKPEKYESYDVVKGAKYNPAKEAVSPANEDLNVPGLKLTKSTQNLASYSLNALKEEMKGLGLIPREAESRVDMINRIGRVTSGVIKLRKMTLEEAKQAVADKKLAAQDITDLYQDIADLTSGRGQNRMMYKNQLELIYAFMAREGIIEPQRTEEQQPDFELKQQTQADLEAQKEAEAAAKKAEEEAQQKAKADSEVDNFQLTGSDLLADQNPNQTDIMDFTEQKPAESEVNTDSDVVQPKNDFQNYREWSAERRARINELRKKYPEADAKLKELEETVGVKMQDYREGEPITQEQKTQWSRLTNKEQDKYSKTKNSEKEINELFDKAGSEIWQNQAYQEFAVETEIRNREVPNIVDGFIQAEPVTVADIKEITEGAERKNIMIADIVYSMQPGKTYTLKEIKALDLPAHKYAQKISKKKFQFGAEVKYDLESAIYYGFVEQLRTSPVTYRLPSTTNDVQFQREDPAYRMADTAYNRAANEFLSVVPEDALAEEVMDAVDEGLFTPEMSRLLRAFERVDFLGFEYPSQALDQAFSGPEGLDNYEVPTSLKSAIGRFTNDTFGQNASQFSTQEGIRARIGATGSAVSGETITRLFNNLNTNAELKVVQTQNELPQHVRDALERQGGTDSKVLGVHSRGVVYVVSSNARSKAEVEETLLHEVSHYGAHRIVGGDAIYRQYSDVYEMMGGHNGIMKTARRMGFGKELLPYINEAASDIALGDWQAKAHVVDEFIAHANGKNAFNTLPKKIKKAVNELIGYIRNKLRATGFVELSKFNDADLAFMIRNIMRNARVKNARMAGAADVQFNLEVGKAAIQNLKNMLKVKYTSDRLQAIYGWYRHVNGRESKGYVVRINPRDFINLTASQEEQDTNIWTDPREISVTQDLGVKHMNLSIEMLRDGVNGKVARVVGHEGRHRMAWFAQQGMTEIPIVLELPSYTDVPSIESLKLLPQQYYDGVEGVSATRVENAQLLNSENREAIEDEFVALPGEQNAAQFALRPRRNNPQQQIPIMGQWTLDDSSKIENFQYEIQDKFVDLKAVLNAIEAANGNVTDQWNPYLREELSHGRSAKLNKDFIQRELNPLLKEMSDAGITIQQLDEFLHARHAKEANAQIATINPSMPDGGSGLLNAEADAYMNSLTPPERAKLTQIANKVEGIIRETQRMMVNYGLESQATIDQWNTTYKHYVPLQREGVIEGGLGMAQGISVRGSSTKRRMGSDKGVVDIFANIAMQRERVISRGEKNRTATALFGLVLQNPNEKFWLAINPDTINTTNAQAGMVPQLVNMGIDPADAANIAAAPMERVIDSSGMVTLRMSTRFKEMPNIITLRINGKDRAILFNQADERAFRLAQSLKNIDAEMAGKFVQGVGNFTRYIAAVNTQYNPVFGLKNYARDVMTGAINLSNTPQASWWNSAKVTANSIPAVLGIWADLRAERNGQQPSTTWGQLFEEFEAEGGKTGYRDLYARSDERARELQKVLNGYDPKMGPKKFMGLVGRGTLNWLSDFNESIENGVRLAAYKLGIENGMSKQQAASMAKNLTVNFNRKGRKTGTIAPWYAFFNAAVQGTARIGQAAFNKKTGAALVGGLMGFGVLQALMLQLAGFEDDEIPEFVRDKNIIIPTGWATGEEKTYLNYPMALGWNAVIGLGRRITEAAFKEDVNIAEEIIGMGGMMLDAFNPVGAGTPAQMISPTILDPIVALSENKDGLGRPIAREDFSSLDQTPGYLRARENASIVSTMLSEALNYLTGGTEFSKGKLSPTPDQIDYLFGVATGGPGRELLKIEKSLNAYVNEDELATYNIPIVGSFVGNAAQSAAVRSRFYDHVKKMNDHQREIEGRAKREEDYGDYLNKYPEAELYKASDKIYRKISDLKSKQRDIRDADGDKDEIKLIDEAVLDLMYNFNEAVKDYKRN